MKKILFGFLGIGLLTLVGCEKDDYTETLIDEVKILDSAHVGVLLIFYKAAMMVMIRIFSTVLSLIQLTRDMLNGVVMEL